MGPFTKLKNGVDDAIFQRALLLSNKRSDIKTTKYLIHTYPHAAFSGFDNILSIFSTMSSPTASTYSSSVKLEAGPWKYFFL